MNSPFFKQPFRYVTAMIVTLTPTSELIRTEIGFLGEAQTQNYRFKFGCDDGRNCLRLPPRRISSSFTNHLLAAVIIRPHFGRGEVSTHGSRCFT
jgi:hypothetical protein